MSTSHKNTLDAALMRHLLFTQQDLPKDTDFYIALSGGVDSVVLCHLLACYRAQYQSNLSLKALHFDHGLNPHSKKWAQFCAALCEDLKIEFYAKREPVIVEKQHSLEAQARTARYAFFENIIRKVSGDRQSVLLTAHHQNDQAETVLINLSKGSHSLPVIREKRRLSSTSDISVVRPLLHFSRDNIVQYARAYKLDFIDDPSNQSRDFDRNYLRHDIIPLFLKRWPQWTSNIARLTTIWQNRNEWQQQYFEALIQHAQNDKAKTLVCLASPLPLSLFKQYNNQFFHDLLHYWLQKNNCALPTYQQIDEWLNQISIQTTGYASIILHTYQLHYYNQHIYLLNKKHLEMLQSLAQSPFLQLNPPKPYKQSGFCVEFRAVENGIDKNCINAKWEIRFKRDHETLQLKGRPNKSLKSLYQEKHIPKWMRDILPLLYIENELVFVPGVGINAKYLHCDGLIANYSVLDNA